MNHSFFSALSLSLLATSLISTDFAYGQAGVAPHPVGSCYGDGVVFYVNKTPNAPLGQRGLIVALTDAANRAVWDPTGTTEVRGTAARYFSGLENTNLILNTVNDPNSGDNSWPAAKAASEYITTQIEPFTSWYLPSRDELALLYLQAANNLNFWNNPNCAGTPLLPMPYWTSTQYNNKYTWYVDFDKGFVVHYPSLVNWAVRSIRAF